MSALTNRKHADHLRADEIDQRQRASGASLWSSSTACGCSPAAGTGGAHSSRTPATPPLAPGWPDDPASVAEARVHPEVFAHKMVQAVTDHYLEAVGKLQTASRP